MTMEEIDRRRAALDAARTVYRRDRTALAEADDEVRRVLWLGDDEAFVAEELASRWQGAASTEEVQEDHVKVAEAHVLEALREWWAQDCQEVSNPDWREA